MTKLKLPKTHDPIEKDGFNVKCQKCSAKKGESVWFKSRALMEKGTDPKQCPYCKRYDYMDKPRGKPKKGGV